MDTKTSLSKGSFVYKNAFNRRKRKNKSKNVKSEPLFEKHYIPELWYTTFKSLWSDMEKTINKVNLSSCEQILNDLVNYVDNCRSSTEENFLDEIIPCATLLTGINHPDYISQFDTLKTHLYHKITLHVCILSSQNSASIKNIIENMVFDFINSCLVDDDGSSDESDSPRTSKTSNIKKSNCNMNTLKAWYLDLYSVDGVIGSADRNSNQLVVIIPDFENFNSVILQDFILILSTYVSVLPFVIIFGVATSVSILHKTFPYQVSSKLQIQVFQSQSSSVYLNEILENVFFNENCPFQLGEKPFKLLIDVFLFYDFSVTGFVQGVKFCMLEHFYGSRIKSLCCPKDEIRNVLSEFDHIDFEDIRRLESFQSYVESKPPTVRILLLVNDEYLKNTLKKELKNFHKYISDFYKILKVLHLFVNELPNAPLGKQIRELYATCMTSSVVETTQFKECSLLFKFISKEELLVLIKKSIDLIGESRLQFDYGADSLIKFTDVSEGFQYFLKNIAEAKWTLENNVEDDEILDLSEKLDRSTLKEKLLNASKKKKNVSGFETAREGFVKYVTAVFTTYLIPAKSQPFHEIFFFDNVHLVKRHIVGSPRAAIHTALVNPSSYLQCDCCVLSQEESILPTMPDLSIIYKLYLECGKLINLYDWLQAFITVIDPLGSDDEGEERREIDPKIQARFTKAVSEMQFLGFIKASKRKTDHVTRLTW